MSYQVFNSTLPIVKTEVDQFLKNYTLDHPYKKALSLPYFRQKFITIILNNIPNNHILIDECHSFADDVTFCIGLLEERLLITKQIINHISTIVKEYHQFMVANNNVNDSQKGDNLIKSSEVNWWIRIDTVKPYLTYYFGPFDNLLEATENCHGYVEDLMEEKAEGITFDFQFINPPSLTIENDMEDLRLENKELLNDLLDVEQDKKYYQNLFLFSPDSCLIIDTNSVIKVVNDQAEKLLKTEKSNLINQSFNKFLCPDNLQSFFDIVGTFNGELDNSVKKSFFSLKLILPDNSSIIVSIKVKIIKGIDNEIIGCHLSLHDVTKLQQMKDELFHQSRYDSLTNLPNRRSLLEFLENILAKGEQNHSSEFAVLFLDINKFKHINDFFGHLVGDEVLINFAKRLITCVRSCDHVARLGGDEFMIVLTHIHSAQEAKDCAYRIQNSLSTCFHINKKEIMVSASIGIVIGDVTTSNFSNLLSQADVAMYQAKSNGQLFSMYRC